MRSILLIVLILGATLCAEEKASFASQSDLVADLSDSVLGGIYQNRLGEEPYSASTFWAEGLGSYREREADSDRTRYDAWLGGVMGGVNYSISCESALNFFVGGAWGRIEIQDEHHFNTDAFFLGMSWEHRNALCGYGFAMAGGYLSEKRTFEGILEHPEGFFFTPELHYSRQLCFDGFAPLFTSTLRYAGFFVRDYQHRETLGTLYVERRSIQLLTLRGDLSFPIRARCFSFVPYIGGAGRFQLDGNHVSGRLIQSHQTFSDGIDCALGYGILGLNFSSGLGCLDFWGNVEGNYDTDQSWRVLGEIGLRY